MTVESQVVMEVARLIASQPSPEQIINFHASSEVNDRAYALIDAERAGTLSQEEHQELESYLTIQHLMILAKAEAHRQLQQQAS